MITNVDLSLLILLLRLNSGDVDQPIIKLRGNRAYLCYWVLHANTIPRQELQELGIDNSTDLFEAAGCLLRLAMWPTDLLFRSVEELSANIYRHGSATRLTQQTPIDKYKVFVVINNYSIVLFLTAICSIRATKTS